MPRGDTQPVPGARRTLPMAARIARRVARLAPAPAPSAGVTPLNPGFFALERMRAGRTKVRAKVRQKVSGK